MCSAARHQPQYPEGEGRSFPHIKLSGLPRGLLIRRVRCIGDNVRGSASTGCNRLHSFNKHGIENRSPLVKHPGNASGPIILNKQFDLPLTNRDRPRFSFVDRRRRRGYRRGYTGSRACATTFGTTFHFIAQAGRQLDAKRAALAAQIFGLLRTKQT